MNIYPIIIGLVYTAIVCSLIWARFNFFKITTEKSKLISYVNDPAVFVQLIFTYVLLWQAESIKAIPALLVILMYVLALSLFWWAIRTAGSLDFASSGVSGKLLTTGAYGFVRHPFYLSYILVWVSSSSLLNSVFLWISCAVLIAIYISSARAEERSIMLSDNSDSYTTYRKKTGMFLPKSM